MSNKTAVVVVCPACGNYPMVSTTDCRVLKNAGDDILYFIARGGNVIHVELTPDERRRLMACKCNWETNPTTP